MNPYLQAMVRRVHDQRDTPGGDQAWRQPLDWAQMWGGDPGIYGAGAGKQTSSGWLGQPGSPVMPPQAGQVWEDRQLPIARNVLRDLDRGLDPVLTGSGLELSPAELAGRRSALDMLQQYLGQGFGQDRPKPALIEDWR